MWFILQSVEKHKLVKKNIIFFIHLKKIYSIFKIILLFDVINTTIILSVKKMLI